MTGKMSQQITNEALENLRKLLGEIPEAVDKGTKDALKAMDGYKQEFEKCMNSSHPQEDQLKEKLKEIINTPIDPEIQHKANLKIDSVFSNESISQMNPDMAKLIKENSWIRQELEKQFAQTNMEMPAHIKEQLFAEFEHQSDPVFRAQLCGQIHSPNGKVR